MRIVNAVTKAILYEDSADTIAETLVAAVKTGAYLRGADLSGADLRGAYLRGAYLSGADLSGADLRGAYLCGAYLCGAYLCGADLRGAYLSGADLSGADLCGAYLRGAYLRGAYLSGADLCGADGIQPERCTPLLMLRDQPGPIRAYKLVTSNGVGPFNGGITYKIGGEYSVDDACTDPAEHCAAGISLATLDWCLCEWREGHRVLIAEFTAEDIAAIPTATDGKFRVHRCKIVAEKDLSGLIAEERG